MAVVDYDLVDWQGAPRPNLHPVLVFQPSAVGARGAAIFFTHRIESVPDAAGHGSVPLIDTETTRGGSHYDVSIEWVNEAGEPVGLDLVVRGLFVPEEGGHLADLIHLPANASLVYSNLLPPLNPTAGSKWLETNPDDPDSQDPANTDFLYEWQD